MYSRSKIEENNYGNICRIHLKSVSLQANSNHLVEGNVKLENYKIIELKKEVKL